MKVVVVVAVLLACANASIIDQLKKLTPSFATPYIIKGQDALENSAPYIVSLGKNPEKHSHICGGTIISKEWVLTAAHCISEPVGMSIIAGLHERLEIETPDAQKRVVDFGRVHELYEGSVGPYDIAILHVSEPFILTGAVQPAALPARQEIPEGDVALYGWGQSKAYAFGVGAKTLQTVETEVVEWDNCKEVLPDDAPLAETNVCSSSLGEGISACNGDSGGPLVKEVENRSSEIIGIVSWGYIPCGVSGMPSIYTRVSAYVDWIADIQGAYYKLF